VEVGSREWARTRRRLAMARFIGRVKGQAGLTSRLGSANSGLVVEANGWNIGVRVAANAINHIPSAKGEILLDRIDVEVTNGSNGRRAIERIVSIVTDASNSGRSLDFNPELVSDNMSLDQFTRLLKQLQVNNPGLYQDVMASMEE